MRYMLQKRLRGESDMGKVNEPELYCPKCKEFVKNAIEEYQGKVREYRTWDGDCYVLEDTNHDKLTSKMLCQKCLTELE
jgi:hypothetical protein